MEKKTKRILLIGGVIVLLGVIFLMMKRKNPVAAGGLAQLSDAFEPMVTKKEEKCFEQGLKPIENQDLFLGSYVDFSVYNSGCIGPTNASGCK